MATEEELNNQDKLNQKLRDQIGITEDLFELNQNIGNDVLEQVKGLQGQLQTRKDIRKFSSEANKLAKEALNVNLKELGTQKSLDTIAKQRIQASNTRNNLEKQIEILSRRRGKQAKILRESLEDQLEALIQTQGVLEKTEETSQNIADNLGVKIADGLSDIVSSIPGLRKFSKPFQEAAGAARVAAAQGKSSAQAFSAGAKSLAQSAKAALPLLIIQQVADAFLRIDKSSGEIAKSLGISYRTSVGLNRQFNRIASSSDSIFVTTANLAESFLAINSALGTNSSINQEILTTQTELVKQAGYNVEAATQLSILSVATGKSSKNITTEFLGQLTLLNAQNKTALNEKLLLESISKISKGTLATFAAQPKELAKAVFQAKLLGLEINQIEQISDSLLDIENSIRKEFEAEVVTGRRLELGRARFLALENDIAGVAKELAAQDITRANFADMNRIQQDAIAEAIGLGREELGEMLIEQEALTKLAGIEGNTAQERFNRLVKEEGLLAAKARIGDETLANQLASVSAQDRFNQSIAKLQDIFVTLIDPLLPILDVFGQIFSIVGGIVKLLDPIIRAAGAIITAFNPFSSASDIKASIEQGNQSIRENWLKPLGIVEDGYADSSDGPFTITDRFGNMAMSTVGDNLGVSPNIQPRDKNRNETVNQIVPIDYNQMARAFASEVSKMPIVAKVDNRQFASNQQTSQVVEQYRFSS